MPIPVSLKGDDVLRPVLTRAFLRLGNLRLRHNFGEELLGLLGERVALRCSNAEPSVRGYSIFCDPLAVGVHEPEIVLRVGIALPGGEAIPSHRLSVILRDPPLPLAYMSPRLYCA